jgi:ADP-ribosylglycohydrolase
MIAGGREGYEDRCIGSALWAAYGDALGFITELADASGVAWRLRREVAGLLSRQEQDALPGLDERVVSLGLARTQPWRRRIGGKFGVIAELPAGAYSDDTQLRLATSRAISNGAFDVEVFAAVEMPIWATYALGAGRSSKAAAANLSRGKNPWFVNSYKGWSNAGGNGALMRVQPHSWTSAPFGLSEADLAIDVFKNSIVSHGHPRAIVPACVHAIALSKEIRTGASISLSDLESVFVTLSQLPETLKQFDFGILFLNSWASADSSASFEETWRQTLHEQWGYLEQAWAETRKPDRASNVRIYRQLLTRWRMFDPEVRGVGTGTFAAGMALRWLLPNDPGFAAALAANQLGSDTDSIATVACAHIGATSRVLPTEPIQDKEYITSEARRLSGRNAERFSYPDLLHWKAPTRQIDAVGTYQGRLAIAGLGYIEPLSDAYVAGQDSIWQWVMTEFGQSLFVKRRESMQSLPSFLMPARMVGTQAALEMANPPSRSLSPEDSALHARIAAASKRGRKEGAPEQIGQGRASADAKLQSAQREVEQSNFDPNVIGSMLIWLAETGTTATIHAFADFVRKAIR